MNTRPRKSTRLTVSLDPADVATLERIAVLQDVSLLWVIRQAIRQFADRRAADHRFQARGKRCRPITLRASHALPKNASRRLPAEELRWFGPKPAPKALETFGFPAEGRRRASIENHDVGRTQGIAGIV